MSRDTEAQEQACLNWGLSLLEDDGRVRYRGKGWGYLNRDLYEDPDRNHGGYYRLPAEVLLEARGMLGRRKYYRAMGQERAQLQHDQADEQVRRWGEAVAKLRDEADACHRAAHEVPTPIPPMYEVATDPEPGEQLSQRLPRGKSWTYQPI